MASFAYVQNVNHPIEKPARVRICASFASRLRGLMFQRALDRDEGLLLVGARDVRLDSAIHMLFVPFDVAAVWINGNLEVVDKVIARAWHPAYMPSRPARFVLEVHPEAYSVYEIGNKVHIINA